MVEPHRYTRVRDLFGEFCACFGDADSVIVAPLYSAGEQPIEGIDQHYAGRGIRATGHPAVDGDRQCRASSPALLRRLIARRATWWSASAPATRPSGRTRCPSGWRGRAAPRRRGSRRIDAIPGGATLTLPDISADLQASCRSCAAASRPERGAGRHHVVPRRRSGAGAVHAGRRGRSRLFPRRHRRPILPVIVIGLGSNLLVRDGGVPGVVIRLGRGFAEIDVGAGQPPSRRHGGAGRQGGARGGRRRHRRARVLSRHSGLDRRRAAHERRRARPRDQGRADRGARRRPCRATSTCCRSPTWASPTATAACPTTGSSPRRCTRARPATRPRSSRQMDEVAEYREKNQPIKERTGGSTFKNPPGHSAWKLIDEAGCRGLRVGGAKVSEMHCNFLINDARRHGRGRRAAGRDGARARQGALGRRRCNGRSSASACRCRAARRAKRWQKQSVMMIGKRAAAHARPRRRADGRLVGRARGQPALGRGLRRGARGRGLPRHARSTSAAISRRGSTEVEPDVCFNALHGRWGEDGCVQGLLEMLGIPYTHSGVLASALAMHKERAKDVMGAAGVPVAEAEVVTRREAASRHVLAPPYVVKPVAEGSSVGVVIVASAPTRRRQDRRRRRPGRRSLMVERYIAGRELTCAVIGDFVTDVIEIVPLKGSRSTTTRRNTRPAARGTCCRPIFHRMFTNWSGNTRCGPSALGLPRRVAGGLPLRRHAGRHGRADLPRGQYAAGHDGDLAGAGAGGACGLVVRRARAVDGRGRELQQVGGGSEIPKRVPQALSLDPDATAPSHASRQSSCFKRRPRSTRAAARAARQAALRP